MVKAQKILTLKQHNLLGKIYIEKHGDFVRKLKGPILRALKNQYKLVLYKRPHKKKPLKMKGDNVMIISCIGAFA